MKIRTAVLDYMKMFPEDYRLDIEEIKLVRERLDTEMAELKKTHAIKRALYVIGTRLDAMIQLKLDSKEKLELSSKEGGRWFANEFSQFRLTKNV